MLEGFVKLASRIILRICRALQAKVLLLVRKGDAEGTTLSKWLNDQELHAFVLETEGSATQDEMLSEVRQALLYIRSRSAEWQVKGAAVGVLEIHTAGALARRVVGREADFAVLITADALEKSGNVAGAAKLFVGAQDAWEKPLAMWLDQFKGKVF